MEKWNRPGDALQSYLIEITADGLQQQTRGRSLVEFTADVTRMKGTGLWTCESANELLVPVPSIYAAVTRKGPCSLRSMPLRMQATDPSWLIFSNARR